MKLFDIETNGLLDTVTKIHCLVIKDTTTGKVSKYTAENMEEGLQSLMTGPICGHNIIKYDIPVIQKLYPWFTFDRSQVFDTLVATRLIYSNLKDIDSGLLKKKKLPGPLFGSHALEAWGYRLQMMKGEYAAEFKERMGDEYEEGMEWREFSPEMLDYCVQDVKVTAALYAKIIAKEYSQEALELEHQVAWLMAQQERNGFPFDATKAATLYATLAQRRGELERELKEEFRFWFAPDGATRRPPKSRKVWIEDPNGGDTRRIKKKGQPAYFERGYYESYTEGVPFTKIKIVEFNPGSRDHIADRLTKLYGWEPELFTEGGKPKVDEEVMEKLEYPPCKLLTEYLMVQKRISQLAEGDNAWLKMERKGKIHGSVNPNGAVTGRATHAFPNIAQVPAVKKTKQGILYGGEGGYGHECRELFGVPPGWFLVGADASGLELRCLAHFMARYDGGKYGKAVVEGDVHTDNMNAAGLDTRDNAKTFIYAFLYGAGDAKIGKIVRKGPVEGKKLKAQFLRKTPALKRLIEAVRASAKRGYLIGLDKRQLHVRSAHAALNTLLQSAGALICKKWLLLLEEELQARGLKHGWDGDYAFCAWVHDEVQIACRTREVAEVVAGVATACVTKAGEYFNFRCPLAGEAKIGTNWAETH
ncbi:DNA polymerase [Bordetella phage vB_BbrP_BB8]|uniref:DNA-directed DNA polymerase n=1 Tax=Bordetella phage vB_BbrP_BB8 TaxID=2587820 RepID=A0A4Y5TNS0_9CAUD|nr:DNA polymerase [Bordetella phage vB_BbrP_BB8]